MSAFNEHQEDYMKSLREIPPALRCWCGWYKLGECPNCKTEKTCADKMAVMCPECDNHPGPNGEPITHRYYCSQSKKGSQ